MAAIDDKFESFARMAINEACAKRDSALRELAEYKESRIKKAETACLEKSYKFVRSGVEKARKSSEGIVSQAPADSRRELAEYRESLIDELFSELMRRVADFKESAEYKDYLLNSIKSGLEQAGEGDITVIIDKSDEKFAGKIKRAFRCEVVLGDGIIGGCIVKNPTAKKIFDNSMSEKLSELREGFLQDSKFAIY